MNETGKPSFFLASHHLTSIHPVKTKKVVLMENMPRCQRCRVFHSESLQKDF